MPKNKERNPKENRPTPRKIKQQTTNKQATRNEQHTPHDNQQGKRKQERN